MKKILWLLSIVLGIICTAFEAVGLAINYWVVGKSPIADIIIGLWKICHKIGQSNPWNCDSLSSFPGGVSAEIEATRILSIVATVAMAIALLIMLLKIIILKIKLLTTMGALFFLIGGILAIAGVGVFGREFSKDSHNGFHLGSGFALCVVAGCLAIVNGIFLVFVRNREGTDGYSEI